jgi:hypothetical protein
VSWHVHPDAGQGVQQRDVAGRLVRAPARRPVVAGADADQDRARVLVHQVQLDLLERALNQERGVGVRERPQPGERQAAGHADQQLLADAHVEHPVRVLAQLRKELVGGDVGEHQGHRRVRVQQLGHGAHERTAHVQR